MNPEVKALLEQIARQVAAIERGLARVQGRQHAVHRQQILKGVVEPDTSACPPETVREEQAPGIPFSRLLRPYGNGHAHN